MMRLKKIVAVICTSILIIECFSLTASALVFNNGDFGFELNTYVKEMTLVEYNGTDSTVTIPGNYDSYPVTRISKKALSGKNFIKEINVPTTLKKIDDGAFSSCTALPTVNFPSFITSLGREICLNCSSLKTAYVNASVDKLPEYTFAGCVSLNSVKLADSIKTVGAYAFQDCKSLVDFNFIKGLTGISEHSFENTGIKKLTVPEGITEIPEYAFANCKNLTEVIILKNVTSINANAFYNDNITIYCYSESYAEQFAIENGYNYEVIDTLIGDVNGDGEINVMDVTRIQKYRAEIVQLDAAELKRADVNGDGSVTIRDATLIQMYCAKKITQF